MTKYEIDKTVTEIATGKKFNGAQMDEIRKGVAGGLSKEQISVHAKRKFNATQVNC